MWPRFNDGLEWPFATLSHPGKITGPLRRAAPSSAWLMRTPKTGSFGPIVILQVFRQVTERITDHADKILAARGHAAKAADGLAFRPVVRHHQHLAVFLKTMSRAFDHVVGRLPGTGKQDFHHSAGSFLRYIGRGTGTVKKNGDRLASHILILAQHLNEGVPRGFRMARPARRQLRPIMQQAVAVNKYSHQRHGRRVMSPARGLKLKVLLKIYPPGTDYNLET